MREGGERNRVWVLMFVCVYVSNCGGICVRIRMRACMSNINVHADVYINTVHVSLSVSMSGLEIPVEYMCDKFQ